LVARRSESVPKTIKEPERKNVCRGGDHEPAPLRLEKTWEGISQADHERGGKENRLGRN